MGAVTRGVFQRIGVNPPRLIMIFRAKRGMTTAGGEGEIILPLGATDRQGKNNEPPSLEIVGVKRIGINFKLASWAGSGVVSPLWDL